MNKINVDTEKCRYDGICMTACPSRIIEMKDGSAPAQIDGLEELCISCGHCVAICPHGALSLDDMKVEDCPPVQAELRLNSTHVDQAFRSRRSIRTYRDTAVEKDKLERLIDIAHYAPTSTNSQQVRWQVVNSREKLQTFSGMVIEMMRGLITSGHPMARLYRLDRHVAAWEAGKDPVLRGAPALIVVHAPQAHLMAQVDSTIALTFLDLAAPTVGLGTCWAGLFMMAVSKYPPLQQALALPDGHACCGVLMIGYPKHDYHRLPLRKNAVISWQE